jgi:DNA-binding HxlR family transcriptional regulator
MAKSYGQYCPVARALDLVGERWSLLIVRELIEEGPLRYSDLHDGLEHCGTNILAARLKELERGGVIRRRTLPPPAASTVYELTEYGRALEGPLLALGRWGAMSIGQRQDGQLLRSEWLAVALKAFFRPEAAREVRATIGLRFEDGAFLARIDDGSLLVEPDTRDGADLVLTTEVETLIGFLAGAEVPAAALAPEGDLALLERLPEIFAFGVGG